MLWTIPHFILCTKLHRVHCFSYLQCTTPDIFLIQIYPSENLSVSQGTELNRWDIQFTLVDNKVQWTNELQCSPKQHTVLKHLYTINSPLWVFVPLPGDWDFSIRSKLLTTQNTLYLVFSICLFLCYFRSTACPINTGLEWKKSTDCISIYIGRVAQLFGVFVDI